MNDDKKQGRFVTFLVVGLIIAIFAMWNHIDGLNETISGNETTIEEIQASSDRYEEALNQANYNIEEAKFSAWDNYESMGNALDNLETVEY